MKTRLSLFLESEKLTNSKLAEIISVQASSISHITSGRNKPGFDFLAKILQAFPDLSPDWLLLGKGEMYRRDEEKPKNPEYGTENEVRKDTDGMERACFDHVVLKTPSVSATLFDSNGDSICSDSINFEERDTVVSKTETPRRTSQQDASMIHENAHTEDITQIIVCYDDKTFSVYRQRKTED